MVQGQTVLEARLQFRPKIFWKQGYIVQGQNVWRQGYSSGTKCFGDKAIVQAKMFARL
jgi:hypothetical protein